jgi:hypothetical protein
MHHVKLTYELNTMFEWLAFQHYIQDILDLLLEQEASYTVYGFLCISSVSPSQLSNIPKYATTASFHILPSFIAHSTLPLTYDDAKVSLNN